jgi:hypothetical protein
MGINLIKGKVGRPKGSTNKSVKQPKLTQADFDIALDIISEQKQEIEYLKGALDAARNSEEHYLMLFDKQVKETQAVCDVVFNTVDALKNAFRIGMDQTGAITLQDIDYNLDLLPRFITHQFLNENK